MKEMIELKDKLGELSEETDIYGPEEIDQFTFEHGYYTCKVELGMTIDQDGGHDQLRLEQVRKLYNEMNEIKFRR